jgi:hypothetical protein
MSHFPLSDSTPAMKLRNPSHLIAPAIIDVRAISHIVLKSNDTKRPGLEIVHRTSVRWRYKSALYNCNVIQAKSTGFKTKLANGALSVRSSQELNGPFDECPRDTERCLCVATNT